MPNTSHQIASKKLPHISGHKLIHNNHNKVITVSNTQISKFTFHPRDHNKVITVIHTQISIFTSHLREILSYNFFAKEWGGWGEDGGLV